MGSEGSPLASLKVASDLQNLPTLPKVLAYYAFPGGHPAQTKGWNVCLVCCAAVRGRRDSIPPSQGRCTGGQDSHVT
jgi:hypothetical protein